MVFRSVFLLGLVGFVMSSCIEHEVIPAPSPKLELECSFEGMVGNQFIEYTENVNGYYGFPSIAKQTAGGVTSAQYFFSLKSDTEPQGIRIGLGSLSWNDASGTQVPALELFNGFFTTNTSPAYSDDALNGFEVSFYAAGGQQWVSRENSTFNQTVEFSNIVQEQDETGDYSKFTATFDCWLYYTYTDPNPPFDILTDSMLVENAVLKGWFKR